jgi:transposase
MRTSLHPSEWGFDVQDHRRLSQALRHTCEARIFRRVQAVLLVAQGQRVQEVVRMTNLSLRSVYFWIGRYLKSHLVDDLHDAPRSGRPSAAPVLTSARIAREMQHAPLALG